MILLVSFIFALSPLPPLFILSYVYVIILIVSLDTLLSTEAVSILERNTQSLNEALISPVQVSQLLYCKRCISEATLNEMERIDQGRSLDDKKTTLLTTIKKTVFNDFRKLKDIATVLSDVEQTKDIANEIMTKYGMTLNIFTTL